MTILKTMVARRSFYLQYLFLLSGIFFVAVLLYSCSDNNNRNSKTIRAVYIQSQNGKYTLYRNGKPFFIKGAAGYTNLQKLKEAGGNTIRTWDTTGIDTVLKNANKYGMAVVVQLPVPYNDDMDAFYNNDKKVDAFLKDYTRFINKYKSNKAILMWCLGNELGFPYKPKYNKFYDVFNQLIDLIHQYDPDHPVTTTMINFEKKKIMNIKARTNIDLISFNIFGAIKSLSSDLEEFDWAWSGPFMITEWGIDGPWTGTDQTAWGAYIENSSTKKAEQYYEAYHKYMPVSNPRFLGSMVFYWGYKQETTPTWFSFFDQKGNMSQSVNIIEHAYTGKWPQYNAPAIKFMLLDNKGAKDNILYKPGIVANARVWLTDTTGNLRYEWNVLPEDWFKVQHVYNQKFNKPLDDLLIGERHLKEAVFRIPAKEGPYRVYVTVYNDKGYFATANTPFYVVEDNN